MDWGQALQTHREELQEPLSGRISTRAFAVCGEVWKNIPVGCMNKILRSTNRKETVDNLAYVKM